MEKSKIVKISGVVVGLILLIVGFSFISTGSSLQGKLSRNFDTVNIENNPTDMGINNELKQFENTLINETNYLTSECSQLKYKLSQLNKDYEKLDKEFAKVHGEREQEYYKAQQLSANFETIKQNEYNSPKAEWGQYAVEYNQLIEEISKIEIKHGMTLKQKSELFNNSLNQLSYQYYQANKKDPNSQETKDLKKQMDDGFKKHKDMDDEVGPILKKLNDLIEKINEIEKKLKPIGTKLKNIAAQITASEGKYYYYTVNLTDIESQIGKKWEEIAILEEAIEVKCGTPKDSSRGDNKQSSGNRGGKNSEQDAAARWSQGIDDQSREIEDIQLLDTLDFEISEQLTDERELRDFESIER